MKARCVRCGRFEDVETGVEAPRSVRYLTVTFVEHVNGVGMKCPGSSRSYTLPSGYLA